MSQFECQEDPQIIRLLVSFFRCPFQPNTKFQPKRSGPHQMWASKTGTPKLSSNRKKKRPNKTRPFVSQFDPQYVPELSTASHEEYYSFGESTWDLVLFIGTGALGPMGSLQTFILAIVNVLMPLGSEVSHRCLTPEKQSPPPKAVVDFFVLFFFFLRGGGELNVLFFLRIKAKGGAFVRESLEQTGLVNIYGSPNIV